MIVGIPGYRLSAGAMLCVICRFCFCLILNPGALKVLPIFLPIKATQLQMFKFPFFEVKNINHVTKHNQTIKSKSDNKKVRNYIRKKSRPSAMQHFMQVFLAKGQIFATPTFWSLTFSLSNYLKWFAHKRTIQQLFCRFNCK